MKFRNLKIFSSDPHEMAGFYRDKLQLETRVSDFGNPVVLTGQTQIEIVRKSGSQPYHFAFNIPHLHIRKALKWLKPKVDIQKFKGREIVDFSAWNAEAIYFYDTDKNIVEFIARAGIGNGDISPFGPHSILGISEMGVASKNMPAVVSLLQRKTGIPIYDGSPDEFCALGNKEGLFICIDGSRKSWIPNDDIAFPSEFEATVEISNALFSISYKNEAVRIEPLSDLG